MSRFSLRDGNVVADIDDGEISAEDAVAYSLIRLCEVMEKIDEKLGTVAWALSEGELKVHRTQ